MISAQTIPKLTKTQKIELSWEIVNELINEVPSDPVSPTFPDKAQ